MSRESQYDDPEKAKIYKSYRPQAPESFVKRILSLLPEKEQRQVYLDVACGSGQLTIKFANEFEKVIGVDASKDQLKEAEKLCDQLANVAFRVDTEKLETIDDDSVDLITVSSAIHWLDIDVFYASTARKLKSGGVLVIVQYFPEEHENPKIAAETNQLWKWFFDLLPADQKRAGVNLQKLKPPTEMFRDVERIEKAEKHLTTMDGSLEDLLEFFRTVTEYHNAVKAIGVDEVEKRLKSYAETLKLALGHDQNVALNQVPYPRPFVWYGVIVTKK